MPGDEYRKSDLRDAAEISVVRPVDAIRQRPGMYIGRTDAKGLRWMVTQVALNSLAESAAGYGRSLTVRLHRDGSVTIADDGRGIDPRPHAALGLSTLEVALTAGFVPPPDGLGRWWGAYTIANALAEWLRVETAHAGQVHVQEFRHGIPTGAPAPSGSCPSTGLTVRLKPDAAIFGESRLSYATLREPLREYAWLHSGTTITLTDEATGQQDRLAYGNGMGAFVTTMNRQRHPLHRDVPVVRGERDGVAFEAGLQWCREPEEVVRSFVNDMELQSGDHLTGLRDGVTRSLNRFVRESGDVTLRVVTGEESRRGLTVVLSLRMAKPTLTGATRARLSSEEARRLIADAVRERLGAAFTSNPTVADTIVRAAMAGADTPT